MRSCLLFFASILPCLLLSFFIFYSIISNQHHVFKVGKQFLIVKKTDSYYEWHQMTGKYLTFPLNHDYGSHAIVLLAALCTSKTGPILELGMGSTSTPMLHRIALEQKRLLVSADSDRRWINHFSFYTIDNPLHQLKYIEVNTEQGIEWSTSGLADSESWNIVFIDHRPGSRRKFDLMLYAGRSDIVIIHDTERNYELLPMY